jgi:hypothetical protein
MPHTMLKALIAAALIVTAATGASSASANWTTNGNATGATFTMTAGAAKWTFQPIGGSPQGFNCSSSSLHGKLFGPSLASGVAIATLDSQWNGACIVVGMTYAIKCATDSQTFDSLTYQPAMSLTTGSMRNIRCVIVKASGSCGNATTFNATGSATGTGITVTGTVNGTYGNTSQQLTINTAGQSLGTSWSSTGCLQGTGTGTASATLLNASGASLVYSTTSTFRPQITN